MTTPDSKALRIAPVSVVVPCYRCVDTIERAVHSVAEQTLRPAELLLVDDASPDGTGAALDHLREKFGADWIRVLRLPRNLGPASARNTGWAAATQPYIAFLDADDAWHPRKIEIQYAWMEAHPEVAISGHGSRQLTLPADIPTDPGPAGDRVVSKWALYRSNPFVTPSVMLRTKLPQRFETGKRHMEDYLLWLEIAADGGAIGRLDQELAYTFKAPFGETGLSAQAWKMELGELTAFATLRKKGRLAMGSWLALSGFSLAKFARRALMLATGYSPGSASSKPTLIYAGAYLFLTQAMTALLIFAGLFGRDGLAAEIGIVQAATLATFFAFSGNARNLILTDRASVRRGIILAGRVALLLPLGAAAVLLSAIVGGVETSLILVLVARRGAEWIGELHLSESELLGRHRTARNSLLLQGVLLVVAMGAIAADSEHLLWILAAWALLPAIPLAGFVVAGLAGSMVSVRQAIRSLLPHYGATAASGMSLYAFRALLVLVAGKAVAGDLFAAFAIGSFPGSLFANVLGPTVSLHEERVGRRYLPKSLWTATILYLASGTSLLMLHWFAPGALAAVGKTPLFWTALGWSLLGGVVMIVAQRVRLKLIAKGAGGDLLGADVLMHVYLIASVPALYAIGRAEGAALLYALNATLALLFYGAAVREWLWPYDRQQTRYLVFGLVFVVFLPLFFMIDGHIFNPPEPVVDSGGILRALPLPASLVACSAGLLLIGRYARATAGIWAIFGLLILMLVSTAAVGGDSETLDRAKMLLLLQVLLPTFGLVLGSGLDQSGRNARFFAGAIFSVILLIVPAQLLATWLAGYGTLRHSVFIFGVYQHLEFVPIVLVCAYLVALPELWPRANWPGRAIPSILLCLLAIYAVAAHAVVAMAMIVGGSVVFFVSRYARKREIAAPIVLALVLGSFASYLPVATQTNEFHEKFRFLFPTNDPWAFVTGHTNGVRRLPWGEWKLAGGSRGGDLMRIAAPTHLRQASLLIGGKLIEGVLSVAVEDRPRQSFATRLTLDHSGLFRAEVPVDLDRGDGDVIIVQSPGIARGEINELRWMPQAQPKSDTGAGLAIVSAAMADDLKSRSRSTSPDMTNASGVPNMSERFADWKLFGRGIIESPMTFLFGHAKPLAREQRSSAHNFYIDFAYNFGVLALLPLLSLILYTSMLLWRARATVLENESLLALALVVAFLVVVECNLKVSLRQPYPGIAIYFLWGLLLARLRDAREPAAG